MAKTNRKPTPEEIARQTVVLFIERSLPSFSRKMPASAVVDAQDDVDRTMLHVSKDLLDRKLLRDIRATHRDLRNWLEANSVSCTMLARGMWLLPLALAGDADAQVKLWQRETARLVEQLVTEKWAPGVEAARKRLGKHFNENEYPSPDRLRNLFSTRARWITYNVPAALEEMNKDLYEAAKRQVEAEWATAGDEIRSALRESFAGLVESLADRLAPDADGKPKVFKEATVEKMQNFLATFAARDLTGDEQLAALARQAQGLLKGKSADNLRKDEDVRNRVLGGMQAIKSTLAKMDVQAPKARRVKIEDEEGVAA